MRVVFSQKLSYSSIEWCYQDDGTLAGLMRFWEQDELRLIKEEQEREADAAMRLVTGT
jgi:hypothetical protein